jgi:methylenetetrahydrofolate reductase (NADPH)
MESQRRFTPTFSFEFFPPRSEKGEEKLRKTRGALTELNPAYFSVTFGAGGSTRDRTFETVTQIQREGRVAVAPHLSCIGSSREQIAELLQAYREAGIRRLVALRGDIPSGMGDRGDLHYASELVRFIRETTGDHFHIEVAAYPEMHPQARNLLTDLEHFAEKVRAGADGAITQYFYNADAYLRFVDHCEAMGLEIPVVPGIMPIGNYDGIVRFSESCGAEIPRYVRKHMEAYRDDPDSQRAFGIDVVTDLCRRLVEAGAPGLHFYTLNQLEPTVRIWNNLGLSDYRRNESPAA